MNILLYIALVLCSILVTTYIIYGMNIDDLYGSNQREYIITYSTRFMRVMHWKYIVTHWTLDK